MDHHSSPTYLEKMRETHAAGNARSYGWRKNHLVKLRKALYAHEEAIYAALYTDLGKNREECWITEIGFTIAEINFALKHLRGWMKPQKVRTNLLNFPGQSYIASEPLGVVLIIGPWNYPLQLVLAPLVGALAAGNVAVLKPSEEAPATAAVLQQLIDDTFDETVVKVVQGPGAEVIPAMMENFCFDHIFYTGSTRVGKIIYELAARTLTPVTLELGGKNPCIIESDADIEVAAKRLALIKFSNAGQMCVAPDYLLVHQRVKDRFVAALKARIEEYYVKDDYHFGKVVNEKAFDRIVEYMKGGTIIYGGQCDRERLWVAPTLMEDVPAHAAMMKEEIFGPLLQLIAWQEEKEVYDIISRNPNPLALYVFTGSNVKAHKWTTSIPFGGGCINNASFHLTNHHLPFGGRGASGTGAYHGKFSFDTFSHKKGIMRTPTWFDPSVRYPPFRGKLNLFKKLIK
jgi:aldehyde dehydrogenase (NAD+)